MADATNLSSYLWRRVEGRLHEVGGCWAWDGTHRPDGYAVVHVRLAKWTYSNWRVHRLLYELIVGPIPDGLVLDHLCRNRWCVNPQHVEPVTDRVNILRGSGPSALAAVAEECVHGHPFDAANTYVRKNGSRYCRACGARRTRERKQRAA